MKIIDPAHTFKANCLVIIDLVEDLAYFSDAMKVSIKLLEELGVDATNIREVRQQLLNHARQLHYIIMRLVRLPDVVDEQLKNVYVMKDDKK